MHVHKENSLLERDVHFRVSEDEYLKMKSLMETYGYRSVSRFWRDLLEGKRLTAAKASSSPDMKTLVDAMNRMTAQIAIIGRNYNQAVARLDALSVTRKRNGDPVINEAVVSRIMGSLRSRTERLRDEVAVCIDLVERHARGDSDSE